MTSLLTDTSLMLWYYSDQVSERKLKKFLLAGIDKYVQAEGDVLASIPKGPAIEGPVVRWMEERGYPSKVTAQLTGAGTVLTISGNLFGVAVTEENIKKVIRVGTILERPNVDGQIKVSSISGIEDGAAPWVATVAAYGGDTPADDSGAVDWEILGEPWYDLRDAEQPRALDRVFREVGYQTHAETFEIPKLTKLTKFEMIDNIVERNTNALLEKLRRQMSYAALRMAPYNDGAIKYGNQVQDPTMCGLARWRPIINTEEANTLCYVNASASGTAQPITKTVIDALIRNLWLTEHANYQKGNWKIVVHPTTHKYIHKMDIGYRRMTKDDKSVGFYVSQFDSEIGRSFEIISDRHMKPSHLLLVNFAATNYGYFKGDEMDRKEIATQGRYQRWLLSFTTYGIVLRNPRSNIGMIYGLPTT